VCRKLRRAIAAVVDAIAQCEGLEPQLADEEQALIESAVAVRQMYTKFRRSLVDCDEDDPAGIRRAIRFAAVSLAVLLGSDAFCDVRLADRRLLRSLQTRIFGWVRHEGSDADGVRLHQDIRATADLLRGINLRQELQQHDHELASRALAALTEDPGAMREWMGRLRALSGRDDAVDQLIEAATGGEALAQLHPRLCDCLARIRQLTGAPPATASFE
jgi:hypothetical protein